MSTPLTPDRADRAAFILIAGLAGVLALLTLGDGVWRTIALALGSGPVDLAAHAELSGRPGWVSQVTVVSEVIGDVPRVFLVIASALSALIGTVVCVAIVSFLVMTARGTPFHRRLFPLLLATGLLMSIGGLLAAGLDGLGRMMAGGELGDPFRAAFELSTGPWAFGFVVLVAAYVLRVGSRLQRETDGLV